MDSLKALLPIGFYLLNRDGADNAMKAFFDRDFNFKKWQVTDVALEEMAGKLGTVTTKYNNEVFKNQKKDEVILQLKSELRTDKFLKYASSGLALFLTVIIAVKK